VIHQIVEKFIPYSVIFSKVFICFLQFETDFGLTLKLS